MKNIFFNCLIIALLTSCVSTKKKAQRTISHTIDSKFFDNQFTGFLVIDEKTKDTLFNLNSAKYFTPASNTKIFTLYTALQLLPERIPALKYQIQGDTLYAEGTGDPTLLHSYFKDSTAIDLFKKYNNIALYLNNFQETKYGPGWAWDDNQYYYQPERSGFPMYGNVSTIYKTDTLNVEPNYFRGSVNLVDNLKIRDEKENIFYFSSERKDTVTVPFIGDSTLTKSLLEKILKKEIHISETMPQGKKTTLYSIPLDSVLKRMMHESDNFLAEQLLIMSASTISDTLNSGKIRDFILENQLSDLEQLPRWVDGSGLSRYNLFSPKSMVQVLNKLYSEVPKKNLFNLFPSGGISGTIENWYNGNTKPYVYAKSGSLGNNYCLSGYLITKSGKTLIFSFMNNHFIHPSSEVKERMQGIFEMIRDKY